MQIDDLCRVLLPVLPFIASTLNLTCLDSIHIHTHFAAADNVFDFLLLCDVQRLPIADAIQRITGNPSGLVS